MCIRDSKLGGPKGQIGATGPQGVEGLQGLQGLQGPQGFHGEHGIVNLWYQSWHPTTEPTSTPVCNIATQIYYHGFYVDTTGGYTTIKLRLRNAVHISGNPNVRIYVAIYSSTIDLTNPKPAALQGQGLFNIDVSEPESPDQIINIDLFSPVYLLRDRLFFIGLYWRMPIGANNQIDFYGSTNIGDPNLSSFVWTQPPNPAVSFPTLVNLTAVEDASGAFWFIVFGNQEIFGAPVGPQGGEGASGPTGPQGEAGPIDPTNLQYIYQTNPPDGIPHNLSLIHI